MTEHQRRLRKYIYDRGYKGAGVSEQLREAIRELDPNTYDRWWAVSRLAMDVIQKGGIVGLFGAFGVGKSLMGAYLTLEYWWQLKPGDGNVLHNGRNVFLPPKPKMVFASEFLRQIQASWKPEAEVSEKTLLENYRCYPLLVVDEVHERSDSEWASQLLITLVKQRESRKMPTVLITNETPKQYAEGVWGSVMDRIVAAGGDFNCTWENLRRASALKREKAMALVSGPLPEASL